MTGARSMLVRAPRLLLLAAGVCAGWPDAGLAQEGLQRCVGHAVHEAREAGAKPLGRQRRAFLLTRDIAHFSFDLPGPGCAGFLAVARRHGQDLQLQVYDPQGRALAEDDTTDAHPYVQACVSAATSVHVSVTMVDGDGEVLLSSLWDAPPVLVGLAESMGDCVQAGLPRPAPVEVGPAPLGAPMGRGLLRLRERLARAGYAPYGPVLSGILPPQGREVRRMRLQAGQCYALAAVGDMAVADIDLRVFSAEARPRLLAADTTRRRQAVAKLCAEHSGEHLLEVRMYDGAGSYAIEPLHLEPPGVAAPPGMSARTRLGFGEVVARLRERGLSVTDHIWTLLPPRRAVSTPLSVRGGRCYAFAAVADPGAGPIELSLTDAAGNLLRSDVGLQQPPVVYHCPTRDATVQLYPHTREARRDEEVLLLVAQDAPAPEVALQ